MKREVFKVHIPQFIIKFSRFFLVVWLALLASCASSPTPDDPEIARSSKMAQLSQQLEKLGIRVIQAGQTMRVMLPSDKLFNPHSANFTRAATPMLNTLAQLMATLETTSVEVAGFTDVEPSAMQNNALSTRQAQLVADYLWSRGVDARLLYAVGYGSSHLTSPGLPGGFKNSANRRIEVKFEYLPLLSSLMN
jgi:intracellular multiplication protein IcmN